MVVAVVAVAGEKNGVICTSSELQSPSAASCSGVRRTSADGDVRLLDRIAKYFVVLIQNNAI